jgi:hypothetical protein
LITKCLYVSRPVSKRISTDHFDKFIEGVILQATVTCFTTSASNLNDCEVSANVEGVVNRVSAGF